MNLFVSLRYLVALDDHRHFGRAALACHVTQPALSNALRALEESFGTTIVRRGRNFAGFTEDGERILLSARRILREHELLRQELVSRADAPQGRLQIGAVPTAMPIAARFVAELQARHPGIAPTLRSMSSAAIETGLETLALDLGLGYSERLDDSRAPWRCLPQYDEVYFLLRRARADGPAQPPAASWREAAGLPLCLLGAEMHNRTIIDRAFAAAGVAPTAAIETNSILTLILSVAVGRVCSILPGALLGVAAAQGGLEALPLDAPRVAVPVAFQVLPGERAAPALDAALALAQEPAWLARARRHAGPPEA